MYPVAVLPYGSSAVTVRSNTEPAVCGLDADVVTVRRFALAGTTATSRRSAPVVVTPPSVATTWAVSTLVRVRLLEPEAAVETPPEKASDVLLPKATAAGAVSVTVGVVTGLGEFAPPEKVIVWVPA